MADSPDDALQSLLPLEDFVPVRVSTHSEMTPLIRFCLEQLLSVPQSGENKRALVLHTLPVSPAAAPPSQVAANTGSSSRPDARFNAKRVEVAIGAIPKLVSVLEIIKREYPVAVEAALSSASATPSTKARPKARKRDVGLHQYTKLTTYENAFDFHADLPPAEQDRDRNLEAVRQELVQLEWLTGSAGKAQRPRQRHSPCMLAVLSVEPLGVLTKSHNFTYQPPAPSLKSSKKRPPAQQASTAPRDDLASVGPQTSTPLPARASGVQTSATLDADVPPAPEPSAPEGAKAPGAKIGGDPAGKRKKPNRRKIRRKIPVQDANRGTLGAPTAAQSTSAMDIST